MMVIKQFHCKYTKTFSIKKEKGRFNYLDFLLIVVNYTNSLSDASIKESPLFFNIL